MLTLKNLSRRYPRLIALLMLLSLLGPTLAGCSIPTTAPALAVANKYGCDKFGEPITYDSQRDTAETTRQVKVKNAAFADCR